MSERGGPTALTVRAGTFGGALSAAHSIETANHTTEVWHLVAVVGSGETILDPKRAHASRAHGSATARVRLKFGNIHFVHKFNDMLARTK
jgi:hypothetical protein